MSLLNDFLVEAATKAYPWKWEKNGLPFDPDQSRQEMLAKDPADGLRLHKGIDIDYDAVFQATNAALHIPLLGKQGIGYRVSFYSDDSYLTPRRSRERWTLDFGIVAASVFDLRRAGTDIEGMYAVTGTGDSFRVMATVIDIMRAFIATEHPSEIRFSAKERSRRKLYERLLALVSKHIPGYRGVAKYAGEYAITKIGWTPARPQRGDEFFNEPSDDDPQYDSSEEMRHPDAVSTDVDEAMQSQAQRRWMWATHPTMAKKWEKETPKGPLPDHVKESSIIKVLEDFQSPLVEVLRNDPYAWTWKGVARPDASLDWSNRNEILANFSTGKITYEVAFSRNGRGEGNQMMMRWFDPHLSASGVPMRSSPHWVLDFVIDKAVSADRIPVGLAADDMTGTGDSIRVYTTVIVILTDFLKRVNPVSVEFDGDPKDSLSRVSFYDRLIRAINTRSIFPGYRGERGGKSHEGHEVFGIVANNFHRERSEETLHEACSTPNPQSMTETLDTPFPWKWTQENDDDSHYTATFVTQTAANGDPVHEYVVDIYINNDEPDEDSPPWERDRDQAWELSFSMHVVSGPQKGWRGDVTGTGNAPRVFATITDILRRFLNTVKPRVVTFSGSGKSRVKFYARLMKKLTSAGLPYAGRQTSQREFQIYQR